MKGEKRNLFLAAAAALVPVLLATAPADADEFGAGATEPRSPDAWYGAGVRPTEARTPEEVRAGFHLPEGFEIDLVASEPVIAKPMNLAFDAEGRLWVSQSVEYPYPAPEDRPGRDAIRVLEDTDGDGHYETARTFVDDLNIPIGLLPYGDGVIAFSIPNLWHFRDTDGDGRCDRREVLYGPFDTTRDTHGMVNALRWGEDGWIYACHGFNNHSRVAGRDGHEVELTSGNTFRFRPDGSRIERFTRGQVNPFGMARDEYGDLYSADCHSKPISQLLRGACYPSFGRPHDGLGFLPPAMDHLHGSTAISGLAITAGAAFPPEYRGQFVSGNVMTSRINRNALRRSGATVRATELPDLLTSDDPWFRPVDIRLGPDGALYVADFYNRIIGHYEVPLEHPGRDRRRGRIWRIRPPSFDSQCQSAGAAALEPIGNADAERLAAMLDTENGTVRRLAMRRLIDQRDSTAFAELAERRATFGPAGRAAALWVLHHGDALREEPLAEALRDDAPVVRLAAVRMIENRDGAVARHRAAMHRILADGEPPAARRVAEALASDPVAADLPPLLDRLQHHDGEDDPVLRQALRIAARDVLEATSGEESTEALVLEVLEGGRADDLADVMLGVRRPAAGRWLAHYLDRPNAIEPGRAAPLVTHAAQWTPPAELDALVEAARRRSGTDIAARIEWLERLDSGISSRGDGARSDALSGWALELATERVAALEKWAKIDGAGRVSWTADGEARWPLQERPCADGRPAEFLCSHPLGESYTGRLRSGAFAAPRELRFWVVGHNGHPREPDRRANRVQLVDARDGRVLRECVPPRSDTAVEVRWSLDDATVGQPVRIETVDNNAESAYAWLGVGRFEATALGQSDRWQRALDEALRWVERWRPRTLSDRIAAMARDPELDDIGRWRCLRAWARLREDVVAERAAGLLLRFHVDPELAEQATERCLAGEAEGLRVAEAVSRGMTTREQTTAAAGWASHRATADWVVAGVEAGWLTAAVLQDSGVEEALAAVLPDSQRERLEALRQSAAAGNAPETDARISKLAARMREQSGDAERGGVLFERHCAACHQIAGKGAVVAPQLDGAGRRGTQRLIEDILVPDRNVDRAFRAITFLLDSGQVHVGLIQHETDEHVEIVETDGKKVSIPKEEIELRKTSARSLMPSGFGETIDESGLADLLEYLSRHAGAE